MLGHRNPENVPIVGSRRSARQGEAVASGEGVAAASR